MADPLASSRRSLTTRNPAVPTRPDAARVVHGGAGSFWCSSRRTRGTCIICECVNCRNHPRSSPLSSLVLVLRLARDRVVFFVCSCRLSFCCSSCFLVLVSFCRLHHLYP
ncbi:hypothetical protein AMAG_18178 [Allomyces macrogynus ATCC 38327]|uniref:Uncharacterized protein n=1 Tax=Allomyces macrogynus (strain ATCC 38327) TaxID=578462 RepID=A0A0L0SAK1_ALLM3|nr:hypothetical protein AMAG_18178 [Allomyces macrogynus ATCC 38327]|eukprot:KNE59439.1 hypothetical protein AMAG_18178 [Allomyces macrogynus ATCC 38327]